MGIVTLALDLLGGDHAPDVVLDGAALALASFAQKHRQKRGAGSASSASSLPELRYHLFGPQTILDSIAVTHPEVARVSKLFPTTQVIGPDVKPSAAVRGYADSSMVRAIQAVAEGQASAVVSAGNTGAYMALSMLILKRAPGIERPAIATLLPTLKGASVVLDLGANVECDAAMLEQFAIMGTVYASLALNKAAPTVGLLNVGSEDLKGKDTVKEAAQRLRGHEHVHFYGFVEGNDIAQGTVDVVVTDGFTGNVALKTAEGIVNLVVSTLREALKRSWVARLGALLARGSLRELKNRLDPRNHNGAILLGLDGVAVKSHGGTDAYGFANAIHVAAHVVQQELKPKILAKLNRLNQGGAHV